MRVTRLVLFAACLPPLCLPTFAQKSSSPTISTDRPSIGTGTDLVPPGAVQLESGATWSRTPKNAPNTVAADWPESELRIGLSGHAELQLYPPNLHWQQTSSGVQAGDFALGAKFKLTGDASHWPVALLTNLSLPTGATGSSSGGVDPTVLIAIARNLPRSLQISASANLASSSVPGSSRAVNSQLALDLGWVATPTVAFFIEAAPFLSTQQDSANWSADGGMTWRVARRVQLDCRAGATVQNAARTAFASIGYSMRMVR
jgi:hypothetical protein